MSKETEEHIAGILGLFLILSLFAFRFAPDGFVENYVAPAWPLILLVAVVAFISVAGLAFRRAVLESGLNTTFKKIGIAAATLTVVVSVTMFLSGYWGNSKPRTPQKPQSIFSQAAQVKALPNKEPAKAVTPPRKTISQNSRQNEPASNDTSPKSNQFVDQCAKLDASLAIGVTTTEFRHMLIELAALQRKSNDTSRAKQVVSDYESVLHFLSLSSGQKLPGGECRLQLDSRGNLPKYLYKLDALGGDNWKEYRESQEALLRIFPTRQYLVTRKRREKDYEDKPVIGYYISKDAAFLIAKEAKKIWEQM